MGNFYKIGLTLLLVIAKPVPNRVLHAHLQQLAKAVPQGKT